MKLSLIVAMTPSRVIGREGGLPWKLSADLKRFKQLTMGHPIIMGRKTYQSIGRPLPGRTSIVLSRHTGLGGESARCAATLDEALQIAAASPGGEEAFIIGGAEVYRESLPRADRLYVTLVQADVAGDTYFPEWREEDWRLVESTPHRADDRNEYDCEFRVFERVGN